MAKLQEFNSSFQKPQYLEHLVFLFTFSSWVLMYGGLNHEFGVRNLEETLALTMENEGEEGFLERERHSRFGEEEGEIL